MSQIAEDADLFDFFTLDSRHLDLVVQGQGRSEPGGSLLTHVGRNSTRCSRLLEWFARGGRPLSTC
jgi:hypothetical protein